MIVAMNNGGGVVLLEIPLERPVVREAERKKGAGRFDGIDRDDVSAVIGTSDTCERFTSDGVEIGELNGIADL